LFCYAIVNNGTISSNGGAGGSPTLAGNCGGGGGGGGGIAWICYHTYTGTAVSVAGGVKGNHLGTGSDGVAGSVGNLVLIPV
jgi:hypothetical protein